MCTGSLLLHLVNRSSA